MPRTELTWPLHPLLTGTARVFADPGKTELNDPSYVVDFTTGICSCRIGRKVRPCTHKLRALATLAIDGSLRDDMRPIYGRLLAQRYPSDELYSAFRKAMRVNEPGKALFWADLIGSSEGYAAVHAILLDYVFEDGRLWSAHAALLHPWTATSGALHIGHLSRVIQNICAAPKLWRGPDDYTRARRAELRTQARTAMGILNAPTGSRQTFANYVELLRRGAASGDPVEVHTALFALEITTVPEERSRLRAFLISDVLLPLAERRSVIDRARIEECYRDLKRRTDLFGANSLTRGLLYAFTEWVMAGGLGAKDWVDELITPKLATYIPASATDLGGLQVNAFPPIPRHALDQSTVRGRLLLKQWRGQLIPGMPHTGFNLYWADGHYGQVLRNYYQLPDQLRMASNALPWHTYRSALALLDAGW